MKIFDLNKKFYIKNKDIVILERQNAIKEAINNVLGLNELDIPMSKDIGANINYAQLKSISHSTASDMVKKIDIAINGIEYVSDVDIKFYYETSTQNMTIKVKTKDLTENIDIDINLAEVSI